VRAHAAAATNEGRRICKQASVSPGRAADARRYPQEGTAGCGILVETVDASLAITDRNGRTATIASPDPQAACT